MDTTALDEATRTYHDRRVEFGRARAELHLRILEALRGGARQAVIVKTTGLSREHIRKLARQHGIEAGR